jgi:hypothetical protein
MASIHLPQKIHQSAFILIPVTDALQTVSAFGKLLGKTAPEKGAALIAPSDGQGNPYIQNGKISFSFENNLQNNEVLQSFHSKVVLAGARLLHQKPHRNYAALREEDIVVAAKYDLDRNVFTEVYEPKALEDWAQEPIAEIVPQRLETPCRELSYLQPFLQHRMAPILSEKDGPFLFKLPNGQLLFQEYPEGNVTMFSITDSEFLKLIQAAPRGAELESDFLKPIRLDVEKAFQVFGREYLHLLHLEELEMQI